MTSNNGEQSNDITSENLKFSLQKYWGCAYLYRKILNKGSCFEVIDLAFSNFW